MQCDLSEWLVLIQSVWKDQSAITIFLLSSVSLGSELVLVEIEHQLLAFPGRPEDMLRILGRITVDSNKILFISMQRLRPWNSVLTYIHSFQPSIDLWISLEGLIHERWHWKWRSNGNISDGHVVSSQKFALEIHLGWFTRLMKI